MYHEQLIPNEHQFLCETKRVRGKNLMSYLVIRSINYESKEQTSIRERTKLKCYPMPYTIKVERGRPPGLGIGHTSKSLRSQV